jgi:hypothetical protein
MSTVRHVIGILGTIVAAIGLLSTAGHLLSISRLYIWLEDVGMAFNTSIGFTLTGTALVIISLSNRVWKQ